MNLNSVDRDEAMKRGDEALNTSSLLFLRSVKCFIATIFYPALNTSLPLLSKTNHCLKLHRRYFLKEMHHLMLHCRYFLPLLATLVTLLPCTPSLSNSSLLSWLPHLGRLCHPYRHQCLHYICRRNPLWCWYLLLAAALPPLAPLVNYPLHRQLAAFRPHSGKFCAVSVTRTCTKSPTDTALSVFLKKMLSSFLFRHVNLRLFSVWLSLVWWINVKKLGLYIRQLRKI